jgi:hypothetical protein
MTNKQYREAIEALGLSQVKAAAFLDINERTSRVYAASGAPKVVDMLLTVMVIYDISVDDVNQLMKRKGKRS